MKIIAVLRLLMLSPVGLTLTNESVCEIMQSTFRICFENRLSDLLRKTAEMALADMIQLLFTRLPTFSRDSLPLLKKLKMRSIGSSDKSEKSKRNKSSLSASGQKKQKVKMEKSPNGKIKQKNVASTIGNATQKQKNEEGSENLSPNSDDPQKSLQLQNNKDEESGSQNDIKSPSTLTSPSSEIPPETPVFNVDADVLARSPLGSVADLSTMDESNEPNGDKSSNENKIISTEAGIPADCKPPEQPHSDTEIDITNIKPQGLETTTKGQNADKEGVEVKKETEFMSSNQLWRYLAFLRLFS